jgi:hypothetical protein
MVFCFWYGHSKGVRELVGPRLLETMYFMDGLESGSGPWRCLLGE